MTMLRVLFAVVLGHFPHDGFNPFGSFARRAGPTINKQDRRAAMTCGLINKRAR